MLHHPVEKSGLGEGVGGGGGLEGGGGRGKTLLWMHALSNRA